jgi:hypothetical protein
MIRVISMELRNLEINILHRLCEELLRRNRCGPVEADVIYQAYSDIPDKNIASSIRSLVNRGLLIEDKTGSQLFITDSGRSEIRSSIIQYLFPSVQK